MLWKAFVLGAFLLGVNCNIYGDLQLGDPFQNNPPWNWQHSVDLFPEESGSFVNEEFGREAKDREPLAPDYKDPSKKQLDVPVLNPKSPSTSYNPAVLPGGVIDIAASDSDSDDFGPFANAGVFGQGGFKFGGGFPAQDDFGFTTFNSRPAGFLGGFFSSIDDIKPWWKGSNVCIEREESTDDEDAPTKPNKNNENETESTSLPTSNLFQTSIKFSNCEETPTKYECVTKIGNHGIVKTFKVTYKCCYGYTRSKQLSSGCDQKIDLKPLLQTAEDLGATEFVKSVQSSGNEEKLNVGNYTLFVPTNQALNDYNEHISNMNDVSEQSPSSHVTLSSQDMVLSHAAKGFVDLTEIVNEQVIYSELYNSTIRINTYPTQSFDRLVTINCARVSKPNNLAKGGIVHMVDGVVEPASQSIPDLIRNHPALTSLTEAFERTDLFLKFKDDGHYTVFAPTDRAFDKLNPSTKLKLLNGDACTKSILKHHVTGNTVCSGAIVGNSTTHNVEGDVLNIERTMDDQLIFENKAKFVKTDIVATNGVIHLIDTIIIPESSLHINDALKSQNLTKFRELINRAGIADEVDNLQNVTVVAPSNEAFEDAESVAYLNELGDDPERLRELILYHTLNGQLQSGDMNNNDLLETRDNKKTVRINLYSTLPLVPVANRATANCARLTGFDEKTCGSVIHKVNKLLIPPTKNIYETIQNDDKYKILREIIKDTEVEKILQDDNRSITFLAPTDETFAGIEENDLKVLKENKEKATEVIKNHILTEVLCCSGVGPHTWGFNSVVPTMSHQSQQVSRTGDHQIRIGRAVVTSCDKMATNGVVHTVNKILFPSRRVNPSFGGFFLFDL